MKVNSQTLRKKVQIRSFVPYISADVSLVATHAGCVAQPKQDFMTELPGSVPKFQFFQDVWGPGFQVKVKFPGSPLLSFRSFCRQ